MKNKELSIQEQLSGKLTDALMGAFDSVIQERKEHFLNNTKPTKEEIEDLISSRSKKNATISGLAGLVPGPLGMLSAVPEIVAVMKNQIIMVYDIGVALEKEDQLNKELIVSVILSSMGNSGIGLVTVHASRLVVKRASLRLFQAIVTVLGGKVTQQLLKSMFAKWIPIVGAGAMAAWSKYSTTQLGLKAKDLLSHDIEIEEAECDDSMLDSTLEPINEALFVENKLMILIGLLKADEKIHELEKEYLLELIDTSDLSGDKKYQFIKSLDNDTHFESDYKIFANNPDESTALLSDMIAFAKRDGDFHKAEKAFIKKVAKEMGVSDKIVEICLV